MINVKKYRATTTRDALEIIKEELGEDALVLETKRVRTGGFMGLRSRMEVEVSAAAASSFSSKQAVKNNSAAAFPSSRILNLTEDTTAAPGVQGSEDMYVRENTNKQNIMAALAERASSAEAFDKAALTALSQKRASEQIEISPEAPRIVHQKTDAKTRPVNVKQDILSENALPETPINGFSREFDLLRAEMREVKYSLGAFSNRQNAVSRQSAVDLGVFGVTLDPSFYEVYVALTATGMTEEAARRSVTEITSSFKEKGADVDYMARTALLQTIASSIKFVPDLLKNDERSVIAIIGATGVGKTTTAAKLAARVALYEQRRVELVTLDTYRIAAVEQLRTYAEIIGAGCHVVRSIFELDAVLRRMPADATVLIDTTGRSPHDLADQHELSSYLQQRDEIRKLLVVQATTHPVDTSAAIKKFEMYGADCLAVTKMDETIRPGAVIDAIEESGLPLAYFCTGQRVPEDIQIATADSLTNRILSLKA